MGACFAVVSRVIEVTEQDRYIHGYLIAREVGLKKL
jgi:hypothetical protein